MKISILSLILVLFVAAFSLYQFENAQQETKQINQALTKLDSQISEMSGAVNQSKTTQQELFKKYQSLTLESDWKIAEVSHFLRLATIELQVSRNVKGSLALLEAADNLLKTLPDPKFFPIRDQIAKEKSTLLAIKLPDIEKLWSDVGALMGEVPRLPTRGIRKENLDTIEKTDNKPESKLENKTAGTEKSESKKKKTEHTEKASNMGKVEEIAKTTVDSTQEDSNFKKGLNNTWQELKDLIKIQHHETPLTPILQEQEQVLARENLLFIFEQMRWAILQSNNTLYQNLILEARKLLNAYFEVTDNRVQHLQESLNELAKIDLHPNLPEIGQALKELQNKEVLQNREVFPIKG